MATVCGDRVAAPEEGYECRVGPRGARMCADGRTRIRGRGREKNMNLASARRPLTTVQPRMTWRAVTAVSPSCFFPSRGEGGGCVRGGERKG